MFKSFIFFIIILFFISTIFAVDYFVVADPVVRGLIKVNAETGDREKITGSWFSEPNSICCDSEGNYYAVDNVLKYVLKINENDTSLLSAGAVSGMPKGEGDWYFFPLVLDIYEDNLYVFSSNEVAIYRVDKNTGDRFYVSGPYKGIGPEFKGVDDITSINNYLYIASEIDVDEYYVYKIDPNTGDRTIVSSQDVGEGPALYCTKICPDNEGNILAVSLMEIMKIDIITGNREIISGGTNARQQKGMGPDLETAYAIAFGSDNFIYVVDNELDSLFKVNPDTGDRGIIWTSPFERFYANDMIINDDGDFVFLGHFNKGILILDKNDWSYKDIQSVYLNKGEITSWCYNIGGRNDYICFDDLSFNGLFQYNIQTQYVKKISENSSDYGPLMTTIQAVAVDESNYPIIADMNYILRINTNTGVRELISGSSDSMYPKGNGMDFDALGTLFVDIDGNYIISGLDDPTALGKVNEYTGDRTIISSYYLGIGSGPLIWPIHFELDQDNNYVGIDAKKISVPYNRIAKIYRDTGDREILIDEEICEDPTDFCFDSNWNYILTNGYSDTIIKIDKITKEKTILSRVYGNTLIGYGWAFQYPASIVLLPKMLDVKDDIWEIYE